MRIEQEQDFLHSVDLVAVVSEYVTLRRHGREYQGLCPFHSERTPSFSVNPEKGFWYCHGCHEGGNAVSFLSKMEGISRWQAVRNLAERQGISLAGAIDNERALEGEARRERLLAACAEASRFYQEQLTTEDALPARKYLLSRGVERACATSFGLGYAPSAPDLLSQHLAKTGFSLEEMEEAGLCTTGEHGPRDRMYDRVIIPIADGQGRTIAFGGRALGAGTPKYLNSPETSLFHKSRTLYLIHRARRGMQREGFVVVVEGYLDALMAHHYGIDNVVATLGTAITGQHLQILQRLSKKIVFALDADDAGIRAVEKAAPLCEEVEMEVGVASFPSGMDPDAYLRSYGPDQFRETLTRAVSVVEYRLATTLQKADLSSSEGKTAALKECTRILAGIKSPMLRDRYVDDLARLWVGAQASGETLLDNMDVLRDEIARHIRTAMGSSRRSVSHRLANPGLSKPQLEEEHQQAEAKLLAALIKKPALAARWNGALSAEDFRLPIHRVIYQLIQERLFLGSGDPIDWFSTLEDDETIKAAAKLLASSEEIVEDEAMVQQLFGDCLRKVKDFDRRVRFEQLRRKFEEMASGTAGAMSEEEIQDYYQLNRYFKSGSEEHDRRQHEGG